MQESCKSAVRRAGLGYHGRLWPSGSSDTASRPLSVTTSKFASRTTSVLGPLSLLRGIAILLSLRLYSDRGFERRNSNNTCLQHAPPVCLWREALRCDRETRLGMPSTLKVCDSCSSESSAVFAASAHGNSTSVQAFKSPSAKSRASQGISLKYSSNWLWSLSDDTKTTSKPLALRSSSMRFAGKLTRVCKGLLLVPLGEFRSEPTTWRAPMSTEIPQENMDGRTRTVDQEQLTGECTARAIELEVGHALFAQSHTCAGALIPELKLRAGCDISSFYRAGWLQSK